MDRGAHEPKHAEHPIALAIRRLGRGATSPSSRLLAVGVPLLGEGTGLARLFGFLALMLASVNIFGGFLVTQRMLSMYKRRERA